MRSSVKLGIGKIVVAVGCVIASCTPTKEAATAHAIGDAAQCVEHEMQKVPQPSTEQMAIDCGIADVGDVIGIVTAIHTAEHAAVARTVTATPAPCGSSSSSSSSSH